MSIYFSRTASDLNIVKGTIPRVHPSTAWRMHVVGWAIGMEPIIRTPRRQHPLD